MEENVIELVDKEGLTSLKLNGQEIHRIISYQISKKELDNLELILKIEVSSKKSSINI